MPRYIPLDREDLAQERALAELEGRDPRQAVKDFIRQEHRFYDLRVPEFHIEHESRLAPAPLVVLRPERSEESKEKRRAYTREWWRKHGREYRKKRAEKFARSAKVARLTQSAA